MQNGPDVAREIARQLTAAEQDVLRLGQQLQGMRAELEQLRAEETRRIAELAKVRLGELDADRITSGLDAADREALARLEARDRERARLQTAIDAGARALAGLMQERTTRVQARDAAGRARDERIAATMQRLAEVEAWQVQREHVAFCTSQAQNADDKAKQAETDRDRKRKPYEADKLFRYLWRRRYRFPDYRALPLFRTLDGWVARLCGYDTAHRDYGMLLAIPERLRAHATGLAATAAAAAEQLTALETEAMRADGVPQLDDALQQAQRRLEDNEAQLAAAERDQESRFAQRAALDAGADANSKQAMQVIDAQLASEDVVTLRADAERTATTADDELVRRIAELRQRAERLTGELAAVDARHREAQLARGRVQELSSRFRREGYDAGDSLFDGLDVAWLLGRLLSGALRGNDAWSTVRQRQRWRPSPSRGVFGGSSGGGIRIGGIKIGGGGFGGFGGGGGFRGGGGFGGGGGFRTGGGF
ncbi:MAG: hypothetical protein JNM25_14435 [Planctomycetes bacterium]|nr:hypothetical protein [Planctomycetota bacterium]